MKVSYESPDKVNGLLTIVIEEDDYKADVEKTLKNYRKKANIPGFRPGMAPMGLIKRQYGNAVKVDAINKVLGESIEKYINDNNINMIGSPLASEKQEPQDLEKDAPYTFMFDIAVAPEINVTLDDKDTLDYYEITVDDKIVDDQVNAMASRYGKYEEADSFEGNDVLKGDLRELDDKGNTLEGGVTVEGASIMPAYIKNEDEKKHFDNAKKGDIITFNPRKAYENDSELATLLKIEKDKVAEHTGNFSFQITGISHFAKHAVDQELFDEVLGKDAVKSEKEFREKIADQIKEQFKLNADFKLLQDIEKYAKEKAGQLTFPDSLLKRVLKSNNSKMTDEEIDKQYPASIDALTWNLIEGKLAKDNNIKVEDKDVKDAAAMMARMQFAQYGMNNVPDEYVNNYADELLKKRENVDNFVQRALDQKLTEALKGKVKLNKKAISLDDFNKMMDEK
ncbi:MAG: trigger factor [Prevotella sp.]|jgi:trigger factor